MERFESHERNQEVLVMWIRIWNGYENVVLISRFERGVKEIT